jgi:hypothetical protein
MEHKTRLLRFLSRPLLSFSFDEVCSLDHESLLLLSLISHNPPVPEDWTWESQTEEDLLVHVLYLQAIEGQSDAAVSEAAANMFSGGGETPRHHPQLLSHLIAHLQCNHYPSMYSFSHFTQLQNRLERAGQLLLQTGSTGLQDLHHRHPTGTSGCLQLENTLLVAQRKRIGLRQPCSSIFLDLDGLTFTLLWGIIECGCIRVALLWKQCCFFWRLFYSTIYIGAFFCFDDSTFNRRTNVLSLASLVFRSNSSLIVETWGGYRILPMSLDSVIT